MAKETIEDEYYQAVARKKDFSKLVLDRYPKIQAKREEAAGKGARRVRRAHPETFNEEDERELDLVHEKGGW
jgi:hypothetical protein